MLKTAILLAALSLVTQPSARMTALMAAVCPALPFPGATADGELPVDHSGQSKWFVVWPTTADDTRIVVRANPLNPETQKAAAAAMNEINAAVAAAERRAQAAYDKAMEQLRRTGKGTDLEAVTLDDEGIAGERIDAELEVVIELAPAESFNIASGQPPVVSIGTRGAAWSVSVPANTYRASVGADTREHFRAAETHLFFGVASKPEITRKGDEPLFRVTVPSTPTAFAVIVRGNEALVATLTGTPDWSLLAGR
jgi:hypothetical protein